MDTSRKRSGTSISSSKRAKNLNSPNISTACFVGFLACRTLSASQLISSVLAVKCYVAQYKAAFHKRKPMLGPEVRLDCNSNVGETGGARGEGGGGGAEGQWPTLMVLVTN